MLETTFIVDADVHVPESPTEMAEYASDPWDVALREIGKEDERYLDLPGMSPRAEYRTPFPGSSNRPQIVTSAAAMRAELSQIHVDTADVVPRPSALSSDGPRPTLCGRAGAHLQRMALRALAHRAAHAEGCSRHCPSGSKGGGSRHPALRGKREWACVYLPASGVRPLYGHHSYDPIYEAAVETGLPVSIHSVEAVFPAFPFQLDVFQTSMAQHCIAHPFAMMANVVSMIETAVPVRWPDLKVAIMEAEVTWVPFTINSLDKEYLERSGATSETIDYVAHTEWKLSWIHDGEVITYPWHSLEFHVPTGHCIAFPKIRLRKFKVRIADGELRVVV
jgi:hypothetical protein